jgi:hypothetical protein
MRVSRKKLTEELYVQKSTEREENQKQKVVER